MKTTECTVKIMSKKDINGTRNDGTPWKITNYIVKEDYETDTGEIKETCIEASTSQLVGELKIGGIYKVVMFISSRKVEKDGKTSYFPSFRITRAELVGEQVEQKIAEAVNDDIPFNLVP